MPRAIGASSWQMARLFVGEGVLLGITNCMLAIVASALPARGAAKVSVRETLSYQ